MTEGVLASFEPVYAALGALGWSPLEADGMDVWQVARFMGNDDFDPVIRGSRGLSLPSEHKAGSGITRSPNRHGRFDPSKITPRSSDPGRIFTGEDAR